MRPYGQRMGAIDEQTTKRGTARQSMTFAPCDCATCREHRAKVKLDTETTMRRVMDKWLRGS